MSPKNPRKVLKNNLEQKRLVSSAIIADLQEKMELMAQ